MAVVGFRGYVCLWLRVGCFWLASWFARLYGSCRDDSLERRDEEMSVSILRSELFRRACMQRLQVPCCFLSYCSGVVVGINLLIVELVAVNFASSALL